MTSDGEIADRDIYYIDRNVIEQEEKYDGFYAVCTNLEDDAQASEIISINQRRWRIEECFRIMKHEFKARPAFLSRDDRIKAHFMTCFLALIVFRYLEKKLNVYCRNHYFMSKKYEYDKTRRIWVYTFIYQNRAYR